MPAGYPQSLIATLAALEAAVQREPRSPSLLVQLAETHFDIGDDLLKDDTQRLAAYEAGAKAAQQAIDLGEQNADAHFVHAVNIGSAQRLRGMANAALAVKEIRRCAERAIAIDPTHAQALQMLGALYIELPWFLGGDTTKAQAYLERAIASDGEYTHARILLATLYRKQGRIEEARRQLDAVIQAQHPHYRYTWERQYKPEAERLLRELPKPPAPAP
ncbi:MAG: tetratricopeptide repeat protein [Nitrospiraceae bacterium]